MMRVLAWALLCFCSTSFAETMDVEYKSFYSHVKKLDDEDTNALQFAFGFQRVGEGRLCQIRSAEIVTDKQTIPLTVSAENRFTVPSDKVLKMAEALVRIDLVEAANLCDMSVQLETKPEYLKTDYSHEDLELLLHQYEAFFNEMGSFLSFMMPSVKGLMIHFTDKDLYAGVGDGATINAGTLLLDKDWIESGKSLALPQAPLRITAIAGS